MNHIDESKSFTIVNSMLKKTRATMQADLSEEKDLRKFDSMYKQGDSNEKTLINKKRRIQFSETKVTDFHQLRKSDYEQDKTTINPQRKQNSNGKKQKQATVEDILGKTLKISTSFYSKQANIQLANTKSLYQAKIAEFNGVFKQKIITILKNLKAKSKNLVCHLNTVYFSRSNIRVLGISQIQKQILKQWRDNALLSSIRSEWFLCIQQFMLQFGDQSYQIFSEILYKNFCQFLSIITYVIFQPYYSLQIQKKNFDRNQIIDRLYKRTIRYIITQSTQWQTIIHLNVLQIIKPKVKSSQIDKDLFPQLYQIVLAEMKIPYIRNLLVLKYENKQPLFPSVKSALTRFINQHYIPHKLKCITQIRSALQQDIIIYEKQLIEKEELGDIQMFQKDPMLTCLILAVLNSQISLQQISIALKEVVLILGEDRQNILRIFECPTYFTDLEVVIQFLNAQANKLNNHS